MNAFYGPCVYAPTLMYHHIQNMETARTEKHESLTVDTNTFRQHMQYLRDKGYSIVSMQDLANFFNNGTSLPNKSILLTFDDGYKDFTTDALPILKEFGYKSTLFLPTGLVENYGYVSWNDLNNANLSQVLIANHTWSHKNMGTSNEIITQEISTADEQLANHGFNNPKVFSYPYGLESNFALSLLQQKGYQLGFTTKNGGTLCKQLRLELPRIRIGNASISNFGF
jgi:peptidoglycan/xylan/chitin deacetylase (PgdA/CDA1 family)